MSNKFSIEESRKVLSNVVTIHEEHSLQGFFSSIGMMSGDYLNFRLPQNLVVVGDIHGDLSSLNKILQQVNYNDYLNNEENIILFLGDYIDRGKFSFEVLLTLCKLKNDFPLNVMMLRGNHESYHTFQFNSYTFSAELIDRFKEEGKNFNLDVVLPLFDSLPVFCEIDSFALLTHAGLPVIRDKKFFVNYKFNFSDLSKHKSLLEELLWNDPRELGDTSWLPSNRGLGKYFGEKITDNWLTELNCKYLIRGHEPCRGFKTNHNSKVVTIFSSKEPYPKFESGYLSISRDELIGCVKGDLQLSNFIKIL